MITLELLGRVYVEGYAPSLLEHGAARYAR